MHIIYVCISYTYILISRFATHVCVSFKAPRVHQNVIEASIWLTGLISLSLLFALCGSSPVAAASISVSQNRVQQSALKGFSINVRFDFPEFKKNEIETNNNQMPNALKYFKSALESMQQNVWTGQAFCLILFCCIRILAQSILSHLLKCKTVYACRANIMNNESMCA